MKNNNTWENFTLLKSEIKKNYLKTRIHCFADKCWKTLANKITGFHNCKVTAYSSSYNKELNFVECSIEICRDYEEVVDIDLYLSAFLDDRRRSYAYAFVNSKYITIKNVNENK